MASRIDIVVLGDDDEAADAGFARLPRPVELVADAGAHALKEQTHRLALHGGVALDAQDVLPFGEAADALGQSLGAFGFGDLDDDGVKVVVVVVVRAVMVRGARVKVVLCGRTEAQDHAGVDGALGDLDHRDRARRLCGDDLFRTGDAVRPGKVGLRQQHHVGTGDLVLEDFGQRRLVVDALVRCALCVHPRHVRREAARRDGLGIGECYDAVDGDARADRRPVEGAQERLRKRQPRGLDQDVVGARIEGEERLDRGDEVVGDRAADTSVRQFDDVLGGAVGDGAGLQDLAVHSNVAELVDDDGEAATLRRGDQVADQRGLARPEKPGDDGDGDLREVGHMVGHSGASRGGMRAMQFLRKCSGLSRHGTRPSGVAR